MERKEDAQWDEASIIRQKEDERDFDWDEYKRKGWQEVKKNREMCSGCQVWSTLRERRQLEKQKGSRLAQTTALRNQDKS